MTKKTFARSIIICILSLLAFLLSPQMCSHAANRVLLVEGSGGLPKYTTEFVQTLASVRTALLQQGYIAQNIRFIAEKADGVANIDTTPTLANIRREFQNLASETKTSDTLLVIMIGQGQSDYVEPKFNLPGRDLSAHELGQLLGDIAAPDQRFILLFPCSGAFSEVIAKSRRVILASTDGPRQIYQTTAPRYFIQALVEKKADTNKDGQINLYEIYEYLTREVTAFYQLKGYLQNENPSIEDNANGVPTAVAERMNDGDGELAKRTRIVPAP